MERFLRKPPKKKKKDGRIRTESGELLSSYQRKLRERLSLGAESEESAGAVHGRDQSDGEGGRGERGRELDYRFEPCRESFRCIHCGREIRAEGAGSAHRNHCPHCLHSLHVDREPGDRASDCRGEMEAIAVWVKEDGEWALIHRCKKCGKLSANRVLSDDNPLALMQLAVKALANPPFPLRFLEDYLRGVR